jgi:hypothetical protein
VPSERGRQPLDVAITFVDGDNIDMSRSDGLRDTGEVDLRAAVLDIEQPFTRIGS